MQTPLQKIRITTIEEMAEVYQALDVDPERAKDPRLNALYVYECGRVVEETDEAYYLPKSDVVYEELEDAEAALFS